MGTRNLLGLELAGYGNLGQTACLPPTGSHSLQERLVSPPAGTDRPCFFPLSPLGLAAPFWPACREGAQADGGPGVPGLAQHEIRPWSWAVCRPGMDMAYVLGGRWVVGMC